MTHEELRTIVLTALAEEHGAESVDDREYPLPTDSALMQAATMSIAEIGAFVCDDQPEDSALLQYADIVADILINGSEVD